MKRPLVFICLFFSFGIVVASLVWIDFRLAYSLLVFSIITAVFSIRKYFLFFLGLALASFFLGICLFINAKVLPTEHIGKFTPYIGRYVTVRGMVSSQPRAQKKKISFILQTKELTDGKIRRKVRGKLLVSCYKKVDLGYGQEVILQGKLYRPYSFRMSQRFNYRDFLKRQGIYSLLSIGKNGQVIFTNKFLGSSFERDIFKVKDKIEKTISANLSGPAAGIINAMVLGTRGNVPQFVNKALMRSGTVHILAVSGLHVGIIVFIAAALFKILCLPHKLRCLFTIFTLIIYCLFTEGRSSVIRATIMAVILIAGYLIERDYEPYSALSLAALIILWANPYQLFDVGFQLSFLSVLSIFLFAKKIMKIFPEKIKSYRWLKWFFPSLSVSLAAWIGTLGIVAYNFNMITPVAILANLVIVPYLFIIVTSGFIFIVFGTLIFQIAPVLALSCEFFISLLYKINSFFISLPGAYFESISINMGIIFLYYGLLLLIFYLPAMSQFIGKISNPSRGKTYS